MPRCTVDRRCYDINGVLVEKGGVALLAPDAKGKLPAWATPLPGEEPTPAPEAKPAGRGAKEKPSGGE